MKPLKEWWLNFFLSKLFLIEARIFVPLWSLMRNAVSFGVTFYFGFNSPFITKKNKTKQNTSGFCQGLFFSKWRDCSYRLVGVEKACWEVISVPPQRHLLWGLHGDLGSRSGCGASDWWAAGCLSETDQQKEEFSNFSATRCSSISFCFSGIEIELFMREARTWGQAQVLPTKNTDASPFWLCVLHHRKLLCLCVADKQT